MIFENKVCVVTGGANGIGRCISKAFLDEGAFVAIIDIKDFEADNFQSIPWKNNFITKEILEKRKY